MGAVAALAASATTLPPVHGVALGATAPSTVTVSVDAGHPIGPVNEGLIGTNQPVSGAGAVMSALGADWGRVDMSLDSAYDCATGKTDLSALDQRVAVDRAMGRGIEPELIVDYSPTCMTTLGQGLAPPNAGDYGPWSQLVYDAAYHEITTQGVRIFEVWNEPDGTFWYGTLADYLAMYQATAQAIEHAASVAGVHVMVGGPALLFPDPVWIEAVLAYVSAQGLPLDFLSWHYYGDYPALGPFPEGVTDLPPSVPALGDYWYNPLTRAQTYGEQVTFVRTLLSAYPQLHPLTVLDEWNLDAGYDPRADTAYDAAFAAAVLDSVQQAGLDRMAFFRVADDKPGTLGNWGMLFSDLSPKPVYSAFLFWHELAGSLLPVDLAPSQLLADPFGRVGAVASRSPDGTVRVLLYDYAPYDPTGVYGAGTSTPYDHLVALEVAGLAGPRHYDAVVVSDAGQRSLSGTTDGGGGLVLGMPGESIALVTLHP